MANKRLSGTLSVIMSTVGSDELPSLLDIVLNQLVGTLDASGALSIFLRAAVLSFAVSPRSCTTATCRVFCRMALAFRRMFFASRVPVACRFNRTLRVIGLPPVCSWTWTIVLSTCCACRICLRTAARSVFPVFYGTQILGVLEVGWKRPQAPLAYDVNVLEVICDYLSIQLVGMASSLALVARPSLAARSMSYVMSCLPF